jgi:hypothetical protein
MNFSAVLNKKEYAIALFCDLRKAFDMVDHKILLSKVQKLGTRGTELLWFMDRKQFGSLAASGTFSLECHRSRLSLALAFLDLY